MKSDKDGRILKLLLKRNGRFVWEARMECTVIRVQSTVPEMDFLQETHNLICIIFYNRVTNILNTDLLLNFMLFISYFS